MGIFSKSEGDPAGNGTKPLPGNEAAAIAGASAEIKSKRGGFRPGAGRKPGGQNATGKVVGGAIPGTEKPNQVEVSEADIEFVKTIAEAGLKILDRIEINVINGLIDSIGDKYISERRDAYLKQREIAQGDYELVISAAGAIAAKYAVLSRYAPEAALLSWACIHGMAFQGVTSDLKKLAIVVKKVKSKGVETADANPPSAN